MSASETILRIREVQSKVGLKKSALYALIAKGAFPRPVKLGERAVGWRTSEIEAWLASREAA